MQPQRWRDTPPAYWRRSGAGTARGSYFAARSRTTSVRVFLSPSLRPHKGDFVSAAATKLREPVAIYFFFGGFPSNLKRGHRHGLAQLRGGGAYRIPLMRPKARRQELFYWCCPWMCRKIRPPRSSSAAAQPVSWGGVAPPFCGCILLAPCLVSLFRLVDSSGKNIFPKTVCLYGTQSSRTNQPIN